MSEMNRNLKWESKKKKKRKLCLKIKMEKGKIGRRKVKSEVGITRANKETRKANREEGRRRNEETHLKKSEVVQGERSEVKRSEGTSSIPETDGMESAQRTRSS